MTARTDNNDRNGNPGGFRELMAKEALRELEARFDARFQAVSARFVRVDNRFAGIDARLDEIERRHASLDREVTTRTEISDAAQSAAEARIDELRERLGGAGGRRARAGRPGPPGRRHRG